MFNSDEFRPAVLSKPIVPSSLPAKHAAHTQIVMSKPAGQLTPGAKTATLAPIRIWCLTELWETLDRGELSPVHSPLLQPSGGYVFIRPEDTATTVCFHCYILRLGTQTISSSGAARRCAVGQPRPLLPLLPCPPVSWTRATWTVPLSGPAWRAALSK